MLGVELWNLECSCTEVKLRHDAKRSVTTKKQSFSRSSSKANYIKPRCTSRRFVRVHKVQLDRVSYFIGSAYRLLNTLGRLISRYLWPYSTVWTRIKKASPTLSYSFIFHSRFHSRLYSRFASERLMTQCSGEFILLQLHNSISIVLLM